MLNDAVGFDKIFIATGYTDLRRGIDGLASTIKFQFDLDPFQKHVLFLFCGKRTDRIKGLVWEGDGFLLLYKRLNIGGFSWPRTKEEAMEITSEQFQMLMQGLSIVAKHPIKAYTYILNQEKYLRVFLEDGEVPIDNNASERAIRGFCIGKKNWQMIDTINGAHSSAIIYSIAETAKANSLKPYDYFVYLLEEIPKHMDQEDRTFLEDLLPWSEKLPEEIRKQP